MLRTSLYDYCAERNELALLTQWHPIKNGSLTPRDVSYGSRQKIWWLCSKGHAWQAAVYTRSKGSGCPYCAGKLAWPGENDLASQRPDLLSQWHPAKNLPMTPERVTVGSHFKAWWICEQGHEWRAVVKSRTLGGAGCPVCANRVLLRGTNDLASTHPELAKQWHPTENGALTPRDVVAGSCRKVWWQCEKGHVWQAEVSARACGGAGCPVCAGKRVVAGESDLASRFPAVAAQWHPEKNGSLLPSAVSPYSNRRVWWRDELGHAWQASVAARTQHGSGCPYCAGHKVPPRLQRPGDAGPGNRRPMASNPERDPHPGAGDSWEPPDCMVGVSRRAHLESHRLFQSGAAEMRLSRLRREGQPQTAGTLPEGAGGAGIKPGRSANSRPK